MSIYYQRQRVTVQYKRPISGAVVTAGKPPAGRVQNQPRRARLSGRIIYRRPLAAAAAVAPDYLTKPFTQHTAPQRVRVGHITYLRATAAPDIPAGRSIHIQRASSPRRSTTHVVYEHATFTAAAAPDYKQQIIVVHAPRRPQPPSRVEYRYATFTPAPPPDYQPRKLIAKTPRRPSTSTRTLYQHGAAQPIVVAPDQKPQIRVYTAPKTRPRPGRVEQLRPFTTPPTASPPRGQTIRTTPTRRRPGRVLQQRRIYPTIIVGASPPITNATLLTGASGATHATGFNISTATGSSSRTSILGATGRTSTTGQTGRTDI